jgi:hypothetical protein
VPWVPSILVHSSLADSGSAESSTNTSTGRAETNFLASRTYLELPTNGPVSGSNAPEFLIRDDDSAGIQILPTPSFYVDLGLKSRTRSMLTRFHIARPLSVARRVTFLQAAARDEQQPGDVQTWLIRRRWVLPFRTPSASWAALRKFRQRLQPATTSPL